jgi:hypothetical protein
VDFSELKVELYARGTDYLSEDGEGVVRAERWLNQAYREICGLHAWPFLEDFAQGAAPLSIPTLRRIRYVRLTDQPWYHLNFSTEEELIEDGNDLTTAGTPEYYYVTAGNIVRVQPAGAVSIDVGFIKRVQPMTGTDVPIFDEEYHDLIVDRAMIKAYNDSDNFEAATALREEFNSEVQAMAEDYQIYTRDVFYLDPGDPFDG